MLRGSAERWMKGWGAVALLALACGCGGAGEEPGTTVADTYGAFAQRLGKAMAAAKATAIEAASLAPAAFGAVAPVPASVTGGVDIGAELAGKTGEKATDIDGRAGDEAVAIFVPEVASEGTSTAATRPSFLAWRSGELCHLAWSKGSSWFVTSPCGDETGAWVCRVTADGTACDACTRSGACEACDVSRPSLDCAW